MKTTLYLHTVKSKNYTLKRQALLIAKKGNFNYKKNSLEKFGERSVS